MESESVLTVERRREREKRMEVEALRKQKEAKDAEDLDRLNEIEVLDLEYSQHLSHCFFRRKSAMNISLEQRLPIWTSKSENKLKSL